MIADEQLGVPIDESLHVVAKRMQSRDVVQIALVARLQREAGTNAADVLDQVADNVRGRLELRRLITDADGAGPDGALDRLAAAGRPVHRDLPAQPGLPEAALDTSPSASPASSLAVIMIVAGSLVIKRIIEIEV